MWKTLGLLIIAFLIIALVPVGIAQLQNEEQRQYDKPELAEMSYQEITFQNDEQGLNLGGMLFIPEGEGPFPAAVIIHGSGTSRRDNGWYLSLVDYLQANGVVVLLPDKRGSVESEGDWHTSSFEDLATDTIAGVEYLRTQDVVDVAGIGVIGMSQGGNIVPVVAAQSEDLTYVVSAVASSLPMHETLIFEENNNLRQMGFLPGISNGIAYFSTAYLRNVTQKDFWGAVGNFDPRPYWEQATMPVLVLYGADDTNVPSDRSVERFNEMNQPNIEVIVYEGSGHALQDPEGQGNRYIRLDALDAIADHIFSATNTATDQA